MSKVTSESLMNATGITKEELDKLGEYSKESLESFDKLPQEQRIKEFTKLQAADVAMQKIIETFHSNPKEQVFKLIELEEAELVRGIISIVGLHTMIGAHFGFLKPKDENETKAN